MQLCFLAHLQPTRMRWENGHISLTSLKTKKHVCRSAIKHSPSAWAGFAPKLTVTLAVAKTKLCIQIFRPALMGDPTARLEALQMPFIVVQL